MRTLSIILLALIFVACESSADDLESKQQLLKEKEDQIGELQKEIVELKQEIAAMDTSRQQEAASATPVKTREVQPEIFQHFVELTGTVTSRENVLVSAEAGGRIESIPVKEGDNVSRGQVLVRLDNEALANQLQEAQAVFELAETTYNKRQKLWDQNIGSEIEYLQAKNNYETAQSRLKQIRERLENTIIKAPIRGKVDNLAVNEGEYVGMGTPVARIVDVEQVEIEAELSEKYLTKVERGDSVAVRIPALDYQEKAEIVFVSEVINPENRSFSIKVKLPNEQGLIKPNALANLRIRDYINPEALVVLSSSIGKDLKGDYVFVAQKEESGEMVAHKQYIRRGKSFGELTEILEGLKPGDQVITAGSDEVNEGEQIAMK